MSSYITMGRGVACRLYITMIYHSARSLHSVIPHLKVWAGARTAEFMKGSVPSAHLGIKVENLTEAADFI